MTSEKQKYLEFLRYSINPEIAYSNEFDSIDWKDFLHFSIEQTLVGIVYGGIERAGKAISISFDVLMEWIGHANQIRNNNLLHVQVLGKTHHALKAHAIKYVFMKGLICGLRYPSPDLRTCGDIDFVVALEDFDRTLKVLESIGKVDYNLVHEHHGMAFVNGVTLEPHYKVHNYQNSSHDRAMQEIFREVFPDNLQVVKIGEEDIPVFPETFESVFLVSHMVNHVYEEGLGLRQVIDYALMLRHSFAQIDKAQHERWLRQMGMQRAHRIFVRICEKYIGLPTDICHYEYSKQEISFADKLMEDILSVGNFGRAAYVFKHDNIICELKNYLWVTMRALTLGYLCPSEAFMWPVSKAKRFFWKKWQ